MTNTKSNPRLVLGIDGGGTKTVAWLATLDDNSPPGSVRIIGKGSAGPSNQRAVGPMMATGNLDAAIESAFADAALPRATVEVACLGLAGADRASDRGVIDDWAKAARVANRVAVVNDAVPLLHVDQGEGCGVALIAGTGSLAWGRNSSGQTARSGGWGYLFGDEGSAFSIGRSVLNAVTRAVDGRAEPTVLTECVLCTLNIASPPEIIAAVYAAEIPRAVIAQLAPLAFSTAAEGDKTANTILDQAAKDLASMVTATASRLELQCLPALAVTGGVLLQNQGFHQRIVLEIEASGIEISRFIVVTDPVAGAVHMACKLTTTKH